MWYRLFSRRRPRRKTNGLSALLTLASFLGCVFLLGAQAGEADSICVTDHLSRQVCLSHAPQRVISLAPSLTESLFALNAGNVLVGRTARCNHPPEATAVPVVGEYMNPDLERLIALKPDLVLAPLAGTKGETLARLAALGIPVFVDDSKNLDDIRDVVSGLGVLLERETEAKKCIVQFDRVRLDVHKRIRALHRPSVLLAVGSSPLVAASGKSFLGSLILEAGGKNIVETERVPFPKFSIEEVLRKDPDFILVLDKECAKDRCMEGWTRHRNLKAVRTGRIHVVDADLVARPSPRIGEALRQLAEILNPDAFVQDEQTHR